MDKFSELKAVERFDADIEENGGEPFAVWVTAINGSHVFAKDYDALLAELEAKDKRILELERVAALANGDDELWEDMAHRMKTMEAKLATPVRLPELCGDGENDNEYTEGLNDGINQSAKAIRTAGFKVEGDE